MTAITSIKNKESIRVTKIFRGVYEWEINILPESRALCLKDYKRLEDIENALFKKYGGMTRK